MAIWGLILAFTTSTVTLFMFFAQQQKRVRTTYFLACAMWLAAWAQTYLNSKSSAQAQEFQQQVIRSQQQVIQQGEISRVLQQQLTGKADEIAQLNKALANRSEQLANYISGGDSIPMLDAEYDGHCVVLSLRHTGKYPMYDLHVELRHRIAALFGQVMFDEATFGGFAERIVELKRADIQELRIGQRIAIGELKGAPGNRVELVGSLYARNGWWREKVSLKLGDGGVYVSESSVTASSRF
jgi:hypothetical protein